MPRGTGVIRSTCRSCCGGWYLQQLPRLLQPGAGGGGTHSHPARVHPLQTLLCWHPAGHWKNSCTCRVWNWECAVPFADVHVGVRAMGIPYSQTMTCGMKTRAFQLKVKMSAWWIILLHQEPGDPANCFCRIDYFENIKKHPKASKQTNKQKKNKHHHHPQKTPK